MGDKLQRSSVRARMYYQYLLDERRSNLSRSEHSRLSEANLIARLTIDTPWRNFLSPEFRKKFQRDVPLFLQIPKFS